MISRTNTYLFFKGNCAEALAFYEKVLGARIDVKSTYGETEARAHVPPALHDKIIHASFRVGDTTMMASDGNTEAEGGKAQRFGVALQTTSIADNQRVFAGLSEGGQVTMPLGKTFFAASFGMVTDRFGIPWLVICNKES